MIYFKLILADFYRDKGDCLKVHECVTNAHNIAKEVFNEFPNHGIYIEILRMWIRLALDLESY